MAKNRQRQEVKSNFPVPFKPEKEGEFVEGVYYGFNLVDDGRGKEFKSHKIKPDDSDEFIGVSGAFLDQKMMRIPKGTYVWVTYKGEEKTKNGNAKVFQVECEEGTKLKEETIDAEDVDDWVSHC